jgi:hypothetical protein
MKALSLWRPWPWAFTHADKRVENRPWEIKFRGDVVFQAAQKFDRAAVPFIQRAAPPPLFPLCSGEPSAHPAGVLAFVATVDDCLPAESFTPTSLERARAMLLEKGLDAERVHMHITILRRQAAWAFGPWCAMLSNIRPLSPIPWKGSQGWFDVPDEIVRAAIVAGAADVGACAEVNQTPVNQRTDER